MAFDKAFKIYKGYNFRILEAKGFDKICFGCPPGIVKDFSKRDESLPSKYILPLRTFVQGKNNFDFEFIVYSFLFVKPGKDKISVYCSLDQKHRFIAILKETLFGPTLGDMIRAQFQKCIPVDKLSSGDHEKWAHFLEKVAQDKKLKEQFNHLLRVHTPDRKIHESITLYFKGLLDHKKWLAEKNIPNLDSKLSKNYILCAQLKNEMNLFQMAKEDERDQFIHDAVDFHIFDKNHTVYIENSKDKRHKLKIVQIRPAEFEIYQGNQLKVAIDIMKLDTPIRADIIKPIEKPLMGVTYLGVGSGFTHKRRNSCLVIWSEGQGIMVDAFSDNSESTLEYGITQKDIRWMILTHVHSDHDSGFIEKILSGQRINLITTRIIFESFIRKIQGITRFPTDMIEKFVEFFEVEPKKKVKLPGFKNTYIEFDYSFHSIPCGRFKLTYKTSRGRVKMISHSGDTKYDVELLNMCYQQGVISRGRMDDILGFIWDADLIIQDVGGGTLHTEFGSLSHLEPAIAKKMVLVHQHKEPFPHPYFRFAYEGQTDVLIKQRKSKMQSKLSLLKEMVLFKRLSRTQLLAMVRKSKIMELKSGEIIFKKNDIGDAFYVILNGFAEVLIEKNKSVIYEKGMFFGELAVTTDNPHRRATVRAVSPLTLLKIPKELYNKSSLPKILDDFYHLGNYFDNVIRPGLVASLGFGDLHLLKKGETLFSKSALNGKVFLILSGKVKIDLDQSNNSVFLSKGDIAGEFFPWKNFPVSKRASAISGQVLAVRLEAKHLKELFDLYPSFYGTVYQRTKKLYSL